MPTLTDIDREAPVIAQHQIDIAAPLATVWDLHINVDDWPQWNHEITAAELDGEFAPGSSFKWTSWGFTVTSTVHAVEAHRRTLWGGAAQGIMGIHEWLFEETPTGVHVVTNESFAGEPVQADPDSMRGTLDTSLASWLARLKTKAESVA
jgi:hypothetical protein